MESIGNRSHQANYISLLGPCFTVVCMMKPGDKCLMCNEVISLPVLGGLFFGMGYAPGRSVV